MSRWIAAPHSILLNPELMAWPQLDFPKLTGLCLRFCAAAQPLTNCKRATCYVNSVVQAWVHTPALANLKEADFKQRCGCPADKWCWLCYLGFRTASSHGSGLEAADKAPTWVLKRLHLLMEGAGSKPGRKKATPEDADQVIPVNNVNICMSRMWYEVCPSPFGLQVKIQDRQLSMCDPAEYHLDFLQKASQSDRSCKDKVMLSDVDLTVFASTTRLRSFFCS